MRIAAVALILLASLWPAAAETARPDAAAVETVLRDAGLFGTWAVDCDAPASPANPRVNVLLAGGDTVLERHELGPDYEVNTYRVIAASRLSPSRVSVEVVFKPGSEREEQQDLVFAVGHDTRRTLYNRIDAGTVVVKDGMVVGHSVRTPTLHKCG